MTDKGDGFVGQPNVENSTRDVHAFADMYPSQSNAVEFATVVQRDVPGRVETSEAASGYRRRHLPTKAQEGFGR